MTRRNTRSGASPFTLEFYVDAEGNEVVRDWLPSISLRKKQVGAAMNELMQHLGVGVCEAEFGNQLGRVSSSSASGRRRRPARRPGSLNP